MTARSSSAFASEDSASREAFTGPVATGGGAAGQADARVDRAAVPVPRTRKLLVPYLTAGVSENWLDYLLAVQEAGADAVEIGLPFSDPMLDGVTIQQSTERALARGVTVAAILNDLRGVRDRLHVPLIAFTYANLVFRPGPAVFCRQLADAGIRGLIVPDMPLDEAREVEVVAAAAGVELTLLVAPVTPDDRLAEIVSRSRGYVYAISRMGTTGERDSLSDSAVALATRVKAAQRPAADSGAGVSGGTGQLPVLVGFGVSGAEQVAAAGRAGDGVVIGSALMRRVLDGATPQDLGAEVAVLRATLDRCDQEASAERTAHAEIPGHRG